MTEAEDVRNNEQESRFESGNGASLAVAQYQRRGSTIYFTHTKVPESLEGQGIGNELAKTALDYARQQKLRVVPRCEFIASYIEKHPEYQDLVDADRDEG